MEKIDDLTKLDEGEKILFDERSQPLKVKEIKEDKIVIEGPKGGNYQVFDEDAKHFLISKPGNREYASYIENLRRVGKWKKLNDSKYRHSDTEALIELLENDMGFWTIKSSNFDEDLDLPKYGFSEKEAAEEQLNKIIKSNPEG